MIVPVRRRVTIDRLLRSFSRNTVRPGAIWLVTNELDAAHVVTHDLDVRLVRFESDSYPIGFNDAALRRNVGIWASTASHVVTFDDDQVAPPGLIQSMMRVLSATPVCWGHYRFIDVENRTFDELMALAPDAGRTRETPPNAWHSWQSAYGGLFGAQRALVQQAGGFDMVFSGRHGARTRILADASRRWCTGASRCTSTSRRSHGTRSGLYRGTSHGIRTYAEANTTLLRVMFAV